MTTRHVLLVSHDAGGTVPPMLALAEALIARGHDVHWLGQGSIEPRAKAAGCQFSAFEGIPDYEPRVAIEDQISITLPVITGAHVGDQLIDTATREHTDIVIVDANLAGCAAAAETLGKPSAVLLHSMYATFTETWFADLWPLVGQTINATRNRFGLGRCEGWADVFAPHDRIISVVPKSFDAPVSSWPASIRHHGFLVPATNPGASAETVGAGDGPLVLVGLSTTYQRQDRLLQVILDALGTLRVRGIASTAGQVDAQSLRCPPNVVVRELVDHGTLLPECDVMITHAGLGSVAASLSRGVPLVCTPIGRDQHLNAECVENAGVGRNVGGGPSPAAIAAAVQDVLDNRAYRDSAMRLADESRRAGGAPAAVADLEALLA